MKWDYKARWVGIKTNKKVIIVGDKKTSLLIDNIKALGCARRFIMKSIFKIFLVFLCLTFTFNQALASDEYYSQKLSEAKSYISDGYPSLAIDELKNLAKDYPDKEEVYCYIGLAYAQGELYDKALYYYNKSLEINPKFWLAHMNLAKHYRAFSHHSKAISHYRKIKAYYPNEEYLQNVVDREIAKTKAEYTPGTAAEEIEEYAPPQDVKQAARPRGKFVADITEWGGNVHLEIDNKPWERSYEGESDYGKFIAYGLPGEEMLKLNGWTEVLTVNFLPQMADRAGIDHYLKAYKVIIDKMKGGISNFETVEDSPKEKIFEWYKDNHLSLCRILEVGSDIYLVSYENNRYPDDYDREKWLGLLKKVTFE